MDKKTEKTGLSSAARVIVMLAVIAVLIAVLSAYNMYSLKGASEIESVDQLTGQKIACCVGWESDYLLTGRDDITLMRYSSTDYAILALQYNQVDAVAINATSAQSILNRSTGAELVGDPIAITGSTLMTGIENPTVLEELNGFFAEFMASEEYDEFMERVHSSTDTFEMADIPSVTDGKTLNVDYIADGNPFVYQNIQTGGAEGVEIELVKRFAYEYGYTVNFRMVSMTEGYLDAASGDADILCMDMTDVYRDDVEDSGFAHMTEPYLYDNIMLLKLRPGEKLVVEAGE